MLGLNLLIKPIWILTENSIQDTLGHETFGLFSALYSLVLVLSVFSDFGINHYVTNTIAKDKSNYHQTLSTFFSARLIILLLFPLLCVGVGVLVGYEGEYLMYLLIIAVTQAMFQFVMLFRAKFQAFQDFITDSIASVLDRVIILILVTALFVWQLLTLENFVYARFIAIAITALLAFAILIYKYGTFKFSFSLSNIKSVIIKTLPFTMMTFLYAINERIDMFMVERLHSSTEAGLYAGAYRWYDAFMMLIWLIMPMFFAKFSSAENEHKSLLKSGKILVAIPIIFIGITLLLRNEFMFFLFQNSSADEVLQMSIILSVLMISYVVNGLFVLYGTYLNAAGFVSKVNGLVAISVAINIVLNWYFVPTYGAIASAYTTALSTLVLSAGYFIMIRKKIEADYSVLLRLIFLSIVFLAVVFVVQSQFTLGWMMYFFISFVAFLILVFLLQLYRPFLEALKQR
jgi:O-antigen/teichoic acid export membrane protein